MKKKEDEMSLSAGHYLLAIVIAALLAYMFCGCAYYMIDPETGEGRSWGFLRSLTVTETRTLHADGSFTVSTKIDTQSTTGDVLLGANELIGTAAGIAEKAKP